MIPALLAIAVALVFCGFCLAGVAYAITQVSDAIHDLVADRQLEREGKQKP